MQVYELKDELGKLSLSLSDFLFSTLCSSYTAFVAFSGKIRYTELHLEVNTNLPKLKILSNKDDFESKQGITKDSSIFDDYSLSFL